MADALKTTETVSRQVVKLTLSPEEADALRSVVKHVGGDPTLSPREHIDSIAMALSNAGVHGRDSNHLVERGEIGIRFRNRKSASTLKAWGTLG